MTAARLSAFVLALAAVLFLLSLFLPWSKGSEETLAVWNASGWETVAAYGSLPAIGLLLRETLRAADVGTGMRSPALPSFFLGTATGFFGIAAFVHLRWGVRGFDDIESVGDFRYGGWIALWSSVAMLGGALVRLAEHGRLVSERPRG